MDAVIISNGPFAACTGLLQPGVWPDLAVLSVLLAGRRGDGDKAEEQKHANFGLGDEKHETG